MQFDRKSFYFVDSLLAKNGEEEEVQQRRAKLHKITLATANQNKIGK